MDKEDVVHIHNGKLINYKEWNLGVAVTWMDLAGIMLSEIIQTEKKIPMISLICENLKTK